MLLIYWKKKVRTKIINFLAPTLPLLDIIKQVLILCRLWQFSYQFSYLPNTVWGFKFWLSQYLVINDLCHPKKHHHFLSLDNFWLRLTVIAGEVSIGPLFTTSQHSLHYPDIYVNRTSLLILLHQWREARWMCWQWMSAFSWFAVHHFIHFFSRVLRLLNGQWWLLALLWWCCWDLCYWWLVDWGGGTF